uniref:hypothetical protein n=1 Tax=Herbidospora sakaeratensis TaxID=564415 RepID=UPI0012FB185E|nr:hypothetical protein [Herbidospora sakaeratensis]
MAERIPVEDVRELIREITTILDVPFYADYDDREKRADVLAHRSAQLRGVLKFFAEGDLDSIESTISAARSIVRDHPVTYRTAEQQAGDAR